MPLFEKHPNWIGGERRGTLKTGDYSVEGMEELLALERKTLPDLINSVIGSRERFIRACERLAGFQWKAILIEATYEDIKSPYGDWDDLVTDAHPNAVCGTIDAIEAKFGIPILARSKPDRRCHCAVRLHHLKVGRLWSYEAHCVDRDFFSVTQ